MLKEKQLLTAFWEQVEFLEKCLNHPETQNALSKQIGEYRKVLLKQKIDKVNNLLQKLGQGKQENKSELMYFVKSSFLLGEIIQTHWDFFLGEEGKKTIKIIILTLGLLCITLKVIVTPDTPSENEEYIILETLKHNLKAAIDVGLKTNAFTQEYITNLNLGDIAPKESESVLIFLSTMKKWNSVYERLAAS